MSESLNKMFKIGCGDNSCIWGGPGGMATNGGCRCYRQDYHHEIKNENKRQEQIMKDMQDRMTLHAGIRLLRDLVELPQVAAALKELVRLSGADVTNPDSIQG